MGWSSLGWRARTFRVVHAAWSVAGLASLAEIWACAMARRRDRRLWASVTFLSIEGAGLVIGRGSCPMGPKAEAWGDSVPFFELVLPPRAAKAAVPILTGVALGGLVALAIRPPVTA